MACSPPAEMVCNCCLSVDHLERLQFCQRRRAVSGSAEMMVRIISVQIIVVIIIPQHSRKLISIGKEIRTIYGQQQFFFSPQLHSKDVVRFPCFEAPQWNQPSPGNDTRPFHLITKKHHDVLISLPRIFLLATVLFRLKAED